MNEENGNGTNGKTPGEQPKKGTGKNGNGRPFSSDDPRINRNGRPKKGESLAELAREFLEETDKFPTVLGKSKLMQRKEAFIQAVFNQALRGSPAHAKLLWNYYDGLPIQKVQQTGGGVFLINAPAEFDGIFDDEANAKAN